MICSPDLIKAAQIGDVPKLKCELEESSIPATTGDVDGCSLLHWSSINNRVDACILLLDMGAEVNATGGLLQETPLMWGVRSGSVTLVKMLIGK
jgi:palmitoyltransferase